MKKTITMAAAAIFLLSLPGASPAQKEKSAPAPPPSTREMQTQATRRAAPTMAPKEPQMTLAEPMVKTEVKRSRIKVKKLKKAQKERALKEKALEEKAPEE